MAWNELRDVIRRARLLASGILIGEIPGRNIRSLFYSIPDNVESTFSTTSCYMTWKSDWLPRSHANDLAKFISDNSKFNFFFFDDDEQESWMQRHYSGTELFFFYSHLKFPAAKSDIFRYCIVSEYGGTFLSINRLTHLSLETLTKNLTDFRISFSGVPYIRKNDFFKDEEKYSGRAAIQYTICSPKKHPVLENAKQKFVERAPLYWNKRVGKVNRGIWELTGPYLLTDAIDEYLNSQNFSPEIYGYDFNDSLWIPSRSHYRYLVSPSYMSFSNRILLGD